MFKRILSLVVALGITAGGLFAQSADDIAKIKFTGIASIQVSPVGNNWVAEVVAEISNQSSTEILLSDGAFSISFVRDGKPFLRLPQALPASETIIPKGSMLSAGKGQVKFAVLLGDRSVATTNDVLVPLFNLISSNEPKVEKKDAAPALTIVLDGTVRYGLKAGEATVFRKEEIRWVLTPKPIDHMVFTN